MDRNRLILTFSLILLVLGGLLTYSSLNFSKLKITACDVGQGDGLIISSKTIQVVVDGGPGNKMVKCLSEVMPFWDREVELVLSTHAQKDHMEGLLVVLSSYKVKMVVETGLPVESELNKAWREKVLQSKAKVNIAHAGQKIILTDGVNLEMLWPTSEKLVDWNEKLPTDLNESSIVFRLNAGNDCAYFTGDITKEILEGLINKPCQVLKVAHHGSKTGTNREIVEMIAPSLAIIQVGKNNRYGHPTKEALDALAGVEVLRTDQRGRFELNLDARGRFQLKN